MPRENRSTARSTHPDDSDASQDSVVAIRHDLINLLCHTHQPALMNELLDALWTDKERKEVENRLLIFRLLLQGNTQREIANQLNVGIATVTRGATALKRIPTHIRATLLADMT